MPDNYDLRSLLRKLVSKKGTERASVVHSLMDYPPHLQRVCALALLNDPHWDIRCTAVQRLLNVSRKTDWRIFFKLSFDPHYMVRVYAAEGLGSYPSKHVEQRLIELAKDSNKLVKRWAIWSLADMPSKIENISRVHDMLDNENDPSNCASMYIALYSMTEDAKYKEKAKKFLDDKDAKDFVADALQTWQQEGR